MDETSFAKAIITLLGAQPEREIGPVTTPQFYLPKFPTAKRTSHNSSQTGNIPVQVKALKPKFSTTLTVALDDTIRSIKETLAPQVNRSIEDMKLLVKGKVFTDVKTMKDVIAELSRKMRVPESEIQEIAFVLMFHDSGKSHLDTQSSAEPEDSVPSPERPISELLTPQLWTRIGTVLQEELGQHDGTRVLQFLQQK